VVSGWPDPEAVFRDALGDLAAVGTRTPVPMVTPFIRAARIGGGDDRVTDVARVAVTVFAATIAEAKSIAEQIRQRVIADGGLQAGSGSVDRGRTETGPNETGTDDPAQVRAMGAIYRVSLRRAA
jgi:hypothetical protein